MGSIVRLLVMAKGTYISENLTGDQISFLKLLDDYEIDYFALDSIQNQLEREFPNLNELTENLTSKGLLDQIERGKYTRPNFKDPYVLGTFIASGKSAVAYWSALQLHGFTVRFPNTIFIKATRQKRSKRLFGVPFKFIEVQEERFVGIISMGYGTRSYPITDPEMTIIDCFDQPRYGGAYDDLIKAFAEASLDQEKMIKYCDTIGNLSVIKRLGYLSELFELSEMDRFIAFARDRINPRYVLLDPRGSHDGPFQNGWKLRLNISEEGLYAIVNSPY